ncbi:MAG TPA: 30S ribosome-binding factor RbfA [Anaerolineales bacterium]|nr:30S ribosome-binding factor RbfA [Anaerolineales bacterium]
MPSQGRANRVAQRIKEELSTLLIFEVSDPRLEAVYITHVKVDRELAYANIFVSALEGSERSEEILEGFARASGFLRSQLARKIQLRSFPHLRFHWDPIPENADRIDKLIASLDTGDEEKDEDE